MKNKKIAILLASLLLISLSSKTMAANTTGALQSSAQLVSVCLLSATDINFGTLTSSAVIKTNGTLSVLCTKATTYSVGLDYSTNMTAPGSPDTISYHIYSNTSYDAAHVWLTGNYVLNATATGSTQTYVTYGATSATYLTPGNYSDTIHATVTY